MSTIPKENLFFFGIEQISEKFGETGKTHYICSMKKEIMAFAAIVCFLVAQVQTACAQGFPAKWKAAAVVSDKEVAAAGLDRCFTAEPLSDAVFGRMQGKSWKKDCTLQRDELRYLKMLHRNAKGQTQLGEMVVNTKIADRVLRIFRKLYESGYRIERMVLIDDYDADDDRSMEANNTSAFNYRYISGTQRLSNHSRGLAIDLNTRYNPYVTSRGVSPKSAKGYAYNRDRRNDIPYKIDHKDLAYKLFKAEGFQWGGDWKTVKDYQHFEFPEN